MTKDRQKKSGAAKAARPSFKKKRPCNKGKSTIQILSTSSGSDRLYNGGSPIQFNAVKATIINQFKASNSYRYIAIPPGATAETIVETTFDEPMTEPRQASNWESHRTLQRLRIHHRLYQEWTGK